MSDGWRLLGLRATIPMVLLAPRRFAWCMDRFDSTDPRIMYLQQRVSRLDIPRAHAVVRL